MDNTSDLTRILRLPGTANRKVPDAIKPVTWVESGPRYALIDLTTHVATKYKEATSERPAHQGPGWRGIESSPAGSEGFEGFVREQQPETEPENHRGDRERQFRPAEFDGIASICAWVQHCRDHGDTLSEPDWYAFLGIVGRCRDGRQLAHKLSAPYPKYTPGETDKKLDHALTAAGPATCDYIRDHLDHANLCNACRGAIRVKSPIVLGDARPKPQPLSAALPAVKSFDPDLLPNALRPWIVNIAERLQVPLDLPAAAAIVALAAATGRRATINPLRHDVTWRVTPSLWGGMVARASGMKSPVLKNVFKPLHNLAELALADYAVSFQQYERDLEGWKIREAIWRKEAMRSGTGPASGFDEPKPEKPPCTRFLVNDASLEKLHDILNDNAQGVLLYRDELSGWFAALDTKGRERDRPFFLESWAGDSSYVIDRIGRGTLHVPHLCISLFGGVQPSRLQAYLTGAVTGGASDDGLAQRLQVLVWPDALSDWQQIDRPHDAVAEGIAQNVFEAIVKIPPECPLHARFSPDAQDLFDEWRRELEQRLRRERMTPALESHLTKYRSLMPSISLLLHLADGGVKHGREQNPEVRLIQAQRAAAWCEYLESHVRRGIRVWRACRSVWRPDSAIT